MTQARRLAAIAMIAATTLTSCGSKTDANERNFSAALTQYFQKKGQLCLNQYREFPVTVSEYDLRLEKSMQSGTASQMAALESAGLVKCASSDKSRRCILTEAAKPYSREKEKTSWTMSGSLKGMETDLCWGQQGLDKVVKWEGPMKLGDYQEAGVTYTYKILNAADWAKKPEVQAAFPAIKQKLDGAGTKESKHAVKLTSLGWEAKGLE